MNMMITPRNIILPSNKIRIKLLPKIVGAGVGAGVGDWVGAEVYYGALLEQVPRWIPPFSRAAFFAFYLFSRARINIAPQLTIERNLLARASIVFHTNIIVIIISNRSNRHDSLRETKNQVGRRGGENTRGSNVDILDSSSSSSSSSLAGPTGGSIVDILDYGWDIIERLTHLGLHFTFSCTFRCNLHFMARDSQNQHWYVDSPDKVHELDPFQHSE
jgi:hypothetical protein